MKKLKRLLKARFDELSTLDQLGVPDNCAEMDNGQTVTECGRLLAWVEGHRKSDLLSVDEVAEMLGVSDRSVWRMVSAGEIPKPVKIGGLTKWRRSDLQAMIDLLPDSQR